MKKELLLFLVLASQSVTGYVVRGDFSPDGIITLQLDTRNLGSFLYSLYAALKPFLNGKFDQNVQLEIESDDLQSSDAEQQEQHSELNRSVGWRSFKSSSQFESHEEMKARK